MKTASSSNSDDHTLALSGSLDGFFEEILGEALREHRTEASAATSSYLVALLREYAHPGREAAAPLSGSLTLLLAQALETPGGERFERLKSLGDGVLYVRGFFPDHLQTRGVAIDYVDSVGARAYDGVASMLRARSMTGSVMSGARAVFEELSRNFDTFGEVLRSIADRFQANAALRSDAGIVKVYERWLKTGSSQLAAALGLQGLVPVRGGGAIC
jgi:hypothetical protein